MTLHTNTNFPTTPNAMQNPELLDWMLDMEGHTKLKQKYFGVVAEQTKLMTTLRNLNTASLVSVGDDTAEKSEAELKKLDIRLGQIKNEMIETEARIMTFVPADVHDTQVLLRFVASVLEFGNKIDADYLADLLIGCSDAISPDVTPAKSASKLMTQFG